MYLLLIWCGYDFADFDAANPFRGPLKGAGPENLDSLGGPKKVSIFRTHP